MIAILTNGIKIKVTQDIGNRVTAMLTSSEGAKTYQSFSGSDGNTIYVFNLLQVSAIVPEETICKK